MALLRSTYIYIYMADVLYMAVGIFVLYVSASEADIRGARWTRSVLLDLFQHESPSNLCHECYLPRRTS